MTTNTTRIALHDPEVAEVMSDLSATYWPCLATFTVSHEPFAILVTDSH